jgi:predicted glycoside hydrolase/deacetylase ChbG (UPF0249 family)
MKYCIVNADDFGASRGINRGIIEAHKFGILTSTSLMVNMLHCEAALKLSRNLPGLSIGIHLTLTDEEADPIINFNDPNACRIELQSQFHRFEELTDRLPTHIDSHHNIHRDMRILPLFLELSEQFGLPMREYSPVRYFPSFYGQWDGETHLEQVSVENLIRILETEISEGITELSCHPGYVDPEFQTGYNVEREAELRTLCDPNVKGKVEDLEIRLINYEEFKDLLSSETF